MRDVGPRSTVLTQHLDKPFFASPGPGRVVFVDVLRLLAAVQMVQGHSVDALLAPEYREGPVFTAWTFARGLTSTTFLVTAGLSMVLASQRSRNRAETQRQHVRRGLELLALGYLLHAPLSILFGTDAAVALREALIVDVLQCIGVSLLAMEILGAAVAGTRARALLAALCGLTCFGLAAVTNELEPLGPLAPLLNYVSARGGSPFPLFPWMGYALCGHAAGLFAFEPGRARPDARLLALGATALALGALVDAFVPLHNRALAPGFLLLKLGIVLMLAGGLARSLASLSRLPPTLTRLSAETLFLYVSHVLVLYAGHVGLKARWGGTQPPWVGLLVAGILIVACSSGALAYRRAARGLRGWLRRGTSAA